ncbi:Bre5p NDAI_0K02780 [Naumovozyma dairenensis CBS 421]|uniref:NTF2 domain-containing protein n=1 Tax=Naumovozyma dairenensis (strain ATCC 10597 / BCRC 20456 / CBS 421 / NBRC 0211 / NRRL Y-12639) TaxID=1071378 RepID=G0WI58_NAUDC|nr:hypothetical protein NDAI_0K02780 [Naumovozyma dairenensis CBS 421]CCD27469.1 hypothetical protein NDAI_0K02780 [Naumovozyma dairenensis CBS 421]
MGTPPTIQEVVYTFVQTYYDRMQNDPIRMSSLYSTTAEFTHINYNAHLDPNDTKADNDLILPTIKLIGRENVYKFYKRHKEKISNINFKLNSVDFQSTNNNNILIMTYGELFWKNNNDNDIGPTFKFVQTFILNSLNSYYTKFDIVNDFIKFIPDDLENYVIISQQDEQQGKVEDPVNYNIGTKHEIRKEEQDAITKGFLKEEKDAKKEEKSVEQNIAKAPTHEELKETPSKSDIKEGKEELSLSEKHLSNKTKAEIDEKMNESEIVPKKPLKTTSPTIADDENINSVDEKHHLEKKQHTKQNKAEKKSHPHQHQSHDDIKSAENEKGKEKEISKLKNSQPIKNDGAEENISGPTKAAAASSITVPVTFTSTNLEKEKTTEHVAPKLTVREESNENKKKVEDEEIATKPSKEVSGPQPVSSSSSSSVTGEAIPPTSSASTSITTVESPIANKMSTSTTAVRETDEKPKTEPAVTPVVTHAPAPVPPMKMTWASKLSDKVKVVKATPVITAASNSNASDDSPTNKKSNANKIINKNFVEFTKEASQYRLDHSNRNGTFEMGNRNNSNKGNNISKRRHGNVNKDGYFPIFVRGIGSMKEEKLKSLLEKQFGPIMKMYMGDNFSVVDFANQENQSQALDKKFFKLADGTELLLEKKTARKNNNNNNNTNSTNYSNSRPRKYNNNNTHNFNDSINKKSD